MSTGSILLVVLGAAAVADVVLASRAARRHVPGIARTPAGAVRGPLAWLTGALVRLYRAAWSGRNAGMCRFEPSCSAYALEAVHRHGGVRGGMLALARVLRCQPLSTGGYDPVPGGRPAAPRRDITADSSASAGTDAGSAVVREPRGTTSSQSVRVPDGRTRPYRYRRAGPQAWLPVSGRGDTGRDRRFRSRTVGLRSQ